MTVLVLTMEIYLPVACSLKDKRAVIKSLLCRVRQQYNVSACEAGHLQQLRRSLLAVAWVGRDAARGRQVLALVEDLVEAADGAVLGTAGVEIR